jgi:hypothetical protein
VTIEYSSWHTPHHSDPGAVERAITRAAGELAYAEKFERDYQRTGLGKALADGQRDRARAIVYFVVSTVGDHDVCDLDRSLERALTEPRANGVTPEQAYAEAIREYLAA